MRDELVRYVTAIVRDGDVAHDLVQDVFVSLWDLRERLEPDCALRSYVYRMARNRAYRYLRDERLHAAKHELILGERDQMMPQVTLPDAETDGEILSAYLRQWLEALPDRQREALSLSRFQGLSHREIAAVMGISARTVNNHILRALSHLEARVQSLEPAESR
jgi:RNA polymerase sigma-70 factor (ECF subfamily)